MAKVNGTGWNLTHQRKLVEHLDAEPLIDYLHGNGVLTDQDLQQLKDQESTVKRNLYLLDRVEKQGHLGQSLLVNALRHSGQLQLANLVDDSARIRTCSGSGYFSSKRHKGQVDISVQVRAIKFSLNALPVLPKGVPRSKGLSTREWVSSEDIQQRMSAMLEPPQSQFSSVQQLQLVEDLSPSKSRSCCLCSCITAMFKRRKGPKQNFPERADIYKSASVNSGVVQAANSNDPRQVHVSPSNGRGDAAPPTTTNFVSSHSTHISPPPSRAAHSQESLEQLQALLELMNNKSNELYQLLQEGEKELINIMSKYWELQRGILFLQAQVREEALVLSIICTKPGQVQQLRRDLTSGYLLKDMEGFIVTDQVLSQLDVLGLKLKLLAFSDELDMAEQEL